MKQFIAAVVASCSLLTLGSGCAVDEATSEDIEETSEALCSNQDGVNSVMAALSLAIAREIRRFMPSRDFQWNSSTGKLELSTYGNGRIANKDTSNVKALLAMQDAPYHSVLMPGGIWLDANALKAALKANWVDQKNCEASGACNDVPVDLQYTNTESGGCGVKGFFNVFKLNTNTRVTDSATLTGVNESLSFLGYPENRMLNFYLRNGQVSVDPTGGLTEGSTSSSGSCTASCTMYSPSSVLGQCCNCNGTNGSFQRSSFSSTFYLCK